MSAGLRFLLDMNLPPSLADWLRAQRHDAVHVIDLGLGASIVLLRLRLAGQSYVRKRLQVAIVQAGDRLNAGVVVLVEDVRIRIREINPSQ